MKNLVLELYMNLVFICIFLDFLYSLFDFYILYRLFCYLFISLLYAAPILIAVFITEMVILHKYVIIIIIIINNNDFINSCTIRQFFYYHVLYETRLRILL